MLKGPFITSSVIMSTARSPTGWARLLKRYNRQANQPNGFVMKTNGTYSDDQLEAISDEKENKMKTEKQIPGWVLKQGRYFSVEATKQELPAGIYALDIDDGEKYFSPITAPADEAVDLPGLPSKYLVDQIVNFWGKAEVYKKFGFLQKRGILMYGEPGCGKTSIISLLTQDLINRGGVVFLIDDFESSSKCIRKFRETEPDRSVMTLMEDIEGVFQGDQGNRQIKAALSLLDGQDQINNIVHVATTNQPDLLADRFIKRPGRFDLVLGIHPPTAETRKGYLKHICNDIIPTDQLDELVAKTEGLSLAYLREIASTYLCLGIPIDETLVRLKKNFKMKNLKKQTIKLGFSIGYEGEA